MSLLVVDTDVVSYVFRRHPSSEAYLEILEDQELVISFMTRAELSLGAKLRNWGPHRLAALEHYLERFGICYPDAALCEVWAGIMADALGTGRPMNPQDAWIAATAIHLDAPVVTNNVRHFRQVQGLEIISTAGR